MQDFTDMNLALADFPRLAKSTIQELSVHMIFLHPKSSPRGLGLGVFFDESLNSGHCEWQAVKAISGTRPESFVVCKLIVYFRVIAY